MLLIKRSFLFPCLLLGLGAVQAQTLSGTAPGFEGKRMALVVYDDLISMTEKDLGSTTVDAFGQFSFKADVAETRYAFLRCGRECADLIIEPGKSYTVRFQRPARNPAEATFSARFFQKLTILSGDGKPLNDRIRAFNAEYDGFLESQYKLMVARRSPKVLGEAVKAFGTKAREASTTPNAYADAHITYSLAQAELLAHIRPDTLHQRYLRGQWLPHHYEYMRFAMDLHADHVKTLATATMPDKMKRLISGRNALVRLDSLLKTDPLLTDPNLRGMVLVAGLRDLFPMPGFEATTLASLLRAYADGAPNAYLAQAARNVANLAMHMKVGTTAPSFVAKAQNGGSFGSDQLTNQVVMLEFTDPTNPLSMEESLAITGLHKVYGPKAAFVTVCVTPTDRDMTTYADRVKPTWQVCRTAPDSPTIAAFGIVALPAYFIINQNGKLVASPAKTPSRGLEEEIIKALK